MNDIFGSKFFDQNPLLGFAVLVVVLGFMAFMNWYGDRIADGEAFGGRSAKWSKPVAFVVFVIFALVMGAIYLPFVIAFGGK